MIRLQPVSGKDQQASPLATKFPFPPPDLPQFQHLQPPPPLQLPPPLSPPQHDVIVECNNNNSNNPLASGTVVSMVTPLPPKRSAKRVGNSSNGAAGVLRFCTPGRCRRCLFAGLICLILSSLALGACLTAWGALQGQRSALAGGTILLLCGVGLFFYSCCTTSHYARVYSGGGGQALQRYQSSLSCHGNGYSPSCYYSPASPMRLRIAQQQQQQLQQQDPSGRILMHQGRNSITDMIQDTVPRCLLHRQSRRHSSLAASIPPVL